ncbi:hypothetical protein Dimus_003447 [Dionaea muscipula]
MAYVINVPNHELPYGELLTRIFEAFNVPLNYKKGEDPKRRRDEEENAEVNNENAPSENVEVNQEGFDWIPDEEEAEIQGESGSDKKFYDAKVEVKGSADVIVEVLKVPTPVLDQHKEKAAVGVDPLGPFGSLPDSDFMKL